ncbi:hypothetical protein EN925_23960 [Mesorhizobium sp. M7A.F.Ca.US.006.04.2.1]|uniref:hypothetical protein n=1 Tax=unclassified Mesorhizobium TaxID=325217 RepID=UPI000FCAED3A|nr:MULTISPECIES: hypothetical protein [unclassified Mesorhizobium]RUX75184.1 hypothetical protein EN990_14725 [Mesorhizobium sp. M7A.F.Ca.US.005.03.1.1]RUY13128.1 hypothetical protein EN991_22150 [Mesorhizobium sp. M7A.F.Ca.US.005.03.2.1]RUY28038.1 hypothetical protein EN979_14640 [Mesorhizobium sp. M7A.F.Ca.US.001.04.2.1]RUY42569.1 hypothetical protein EN978_11925 [Mesorhizobium sp. M7A.F.Ca.US.001.04.1.1]RVA03009.1 hypothetical protein EN938_17430 [Mesorhizobium sp. M7A.F.Ca.US.001.02.1.1]
MKFIGHSSGAFCFATADAVAVKATKAIKQKVTSGPRRVVTLKSPTYPRITIIALGLSDTTFFNSPLDDAVDISIKKGIQLVDEQGDRIFG